jgi:hypothetical protein
MSRSERPFLTPSSWPRGKLFLDTTSHEGTEPMRTMKLLGAAAALITAALVGGTLIGSAFAAPSGPSTEAQEAVALPGSGEYCQAFLGAFTAELGKDEAALEAAWRTSVDAAIDAAVEAGDLDAERATALKENIAEADLNMCRILAGRPGLVWKEIGQRAKGHFIRDAVGVAAETLGMEPSELVEAVRGGSSLEEVAGEQDVAYDDVKAAVLASVKTDLDTAVAEGLITQERADAVYERLQAWLDDGGELPEKGPGSGRRWHGPRGFGPRGGDQPADPPAEESPEPSAG